MTFKIEKGIPAPDARGKYPWNEMEVGDSFLVPRADLKSSTRSSVQARNINHPETEFRGTMVTDGYRIWRIK